MINSSRKVRIEVLRPALFCVGAALLSWQTMAAAVTVSDSTFVNTDWTITSFSSFNGGTSSAAQVASGGNPGPYRNVTDTLNNGGVPSVVLGVSIYSPFTYNPAVSGAISAVDYSEDAACISGCFGSGQSTGPALLQGGVIYVLGSSSVITGPGAAFVNHSLSGLTAADFGGVSLTGSTFVDNSVHPNFSASGAPIQFGFLRANGTGPGGIGYTLAAGIDNWQVTITSAALPPSGITTIPTLGTAEMVLLAFAIGLLGLFYSRRTD
jgi:hypothetical protein